MAVRCVLDRSEAFNIPIPHKSIIPIRLTKRFCLNYHEIEMALGMVIFQNVSNYASIRANIVFVCCDIEISCPSNFCTIYKRVDEVIKF